MTAVAQEVWNRMLIFKSLMETNDILNTPHARGLLNRYRSAYDTLKSLAEQVRA
jgi:hypothetical protein